VLLLPRAVKVLLAAQPVDLRKSIDGLANIVRSGWHEDVYGGHLFVFVSRRRDRVKILTWDSGGFVVFCKRLEQGRFKLPSFHDDSLGAILGSADLSMLLDGIDLSHVRRRKKCGGDSISTTDCARFAFSGSGRSKRPNGGKTLSVPQLRKSILAIHLQVTRLAGIWEGLALHH
jgi:transposase